MNEKVYKIMKRAGAFGIVLGVISICAGVSIGVLSIIIGARLLKSKSEITF